MGAKGLEQFETGAAGEHDIEDDDVVFAGERSIEAGAVIEDGVDVEALVLEEALEERNQSTIVVNDEYSAHAIYSARDGGLGL
jgi:hypothetical protein